MRMPSRTMILLNGAVALVAVASIVTMGRSIMGVDRLESCRERYPNAIQWSLQRDNGELLSSSDLQARLGASDWGLIERATVVKADNAYGAALSVDLAGPTGRGSAGGSPASAGFEWAPQSISGVRAGCASYAVMLDRQFAFATGGRLPGLLGGPAGADRHTPDAFSTRLAWDKNGVLGIRGHMPGQTLDVRNEQGEAELPRGRWVAVDQEVILNKPGRNDGVVRVWLDGKLRFESRNLALRTDRDAEIRGILAEVSYLGQPAAADGSGRVAITPFEFRW